MSKFQCLRFFAALIIAAVIAFASFMMNPTMGIVCIAVAVGGGAYFLYKYTKNFKMLKLTITKGITVVANQLKTDISADKKERILKRTINYVDINPRISQTELVCFIGYSIADGNRLLEEAAEKLNKQYKEMETTRRIIRAMAVENILMDENYIASLKEIIEKVLLTPPQKRTKARKISK